MKVELSNTNMALGAALVVVIAIAFYMYMRPGVGRPGAGAAARPAAAPTAPPTALEPAKAAPPPPTPDVTKIGESVSQGKLTLLYHRGCGWSVRFINDTWNKVKEGAGELQLTRQAIDFAEPPDGAQDLAEFKAAQAHSKGGLGFPTVVHTTASGEHRVHAGHTDVTTFLGWIKAGK